MKKKQQQQNIVYDRDSFTSQKLIDEAMTYLLKAHHAKLIKPIKCNKVKLSYVRHAEFLLEKLEKAMHAKRYQYNT